MGIDARRGQRWEGGTGGVTLGLGLCKRRAVHRNMNGGLPALTLKQCFCLVSCGVLTCTAREAGTCSGHSNVNQPTAPFFSSNPATYFQRDATASHHCHPDEWRDTGTRASWCRRNTPDRLCVCVWTCARFGDK